MLEFGQPLYSKVLTFNGFVLMNLLQEGDEILDDKGRAQKVLSITEGTGRLYEVHTNDGFVVECATDHPFRLVDRDGRSPRKVAAHDISTGDHSFLPKVDLTTYHHPSRVMGRVFSPTALGLMLLEREPTRGSVSIVPEQPELVTSYISTPPDYALSVPSDPDKVRFVWEEETLETDPAYPWLSKALLFSGSSDRFQIPEEYLDSSYEVRSDLVAALAGVARKAHSRKGPPTITDWGRVPMRHPSYGTMLRSLIASLGMSPSFDPRHVVGTYPTGVTVEVRGITVSGSSGMYITDGYIPIQSLSKE